MQHNAETNMNEFDEATKSKTNLIEFEAWYNSMWWNLTDFRELFQWLVLNVDKQKFVIKYNTSPVRQPTIKWQALFL